MYQGNTDLSYPEHPQISRYLSRQARGPVPAHQTNLIRVGGRGGGRVGNQLLNLAESKSNAAGQPAADASQSNSSFSPPNSIHTILTYICRTKFLIICRYVHYL